MRLDRHIERGGRLVGDQHIGLVGDRHRDHDALPLPARELVRIRAQPVLGIGQTDQPQQIEGPPARCYGCHVLVDQQGLGDLPLEGVQRVQRGHRLLKDDRDPVAAYPAQLFRRGADQFFPIQANAAFGPVRRDRIR